MLAMVCCAALAGCIRALPDPVYKQDEWTIHLIQGCSEGSVFVDTLQITDLSFEVNRTGECFYIQAGRMLDPSAPEAFQVAINGTMSYLSVRCGNSHFEDYTDRASFEVPPEANKKVVCLIWTQPSTTAEEFVLRVNWTRQ
ncbi:MAG TPA: hypothetical protein VM327_09215 [Candidatus Thermoplasmatota archaeon]|nr:hypothetical protein [Candidatus Thermoplasmatota archaeon]